jgi:hypothetical protein
MVSIPSDIINIILEYVSHLRSMKWRPFIDNKTGKLIWKVNTYSKKYIDHSRTIAHNNDELYYTTEKIHPLCKVIEGTIHVHKYANYDYEFEISEFPFKGVLFEYINKSFKLYCEFNSENETEKNKYTYRTMVNFVKKQNGEHLFETEKWEAHNLYLNGTKHYSINNAYYCMNESRVYLICEI